MAREENHELFYLTHINENITNKTIVNQIQHHIKKSYTMTKFLVVISLKIYPICHWKYLLTGNTLSQFKLSFSQAQTSLSEEKFIFITFSKILDID